jgi:4-amino-4-deoxychorismate lyase
MSLLIETIRVSNGQPMHLGLHLHRMQASRKALFNIEDRIGLENVFSSNITHTKGIYKCRLTYGSHIHSVQFEPYTPKKISSLRMLECDDIDYGHKYADRSAIEKFFALRDPCDDILIVKNGLITDSSFCNIVVHDGTRWLTPKQPLLRGIMRQHLLNIGQVHEADIEPSEFLGMKKYRLINAMLPFDTAADHSLETILY